MTHSDTPALHPATHIIIALQLIVYCISLSAIAGFCLLAVWFAVSVSLPNRTGFNLTWKLVKLLLIGAVFLFLIHGFTIEPFGVSAHGVNIAMENFARIAAPVTGMIYLSRRITSEELFSMLIEYRIPPELILIMFRTLWLVPRLTERIEEVLNAQKLRGMRVDTSMMRVRALLPTLSPILSSMLNEISVNSLIMTTRGFLMPGIKTHYTPLRFTARDAGVMIIVTFILGILWF